MISRRHREVLVATGVDLAAAVVIVLSNAFWRFGTGPGPLIVNVAVGVVIALVAVVRMLDLNQASWLSWLLAALGLWIAVSPWFVGFARATEPLLWSNVLAGMLV